MTLILSPLGVSLGTVKRQDAPAFTEDKALQDDGAVAAASPAVLEHLNQGTALLLLQSHIYIRVSTLLIHQADLHSCLGCHCICSHVLSKVFTQII